MKLSDKALDTTFRVMVYGGPKTGKTELAGQLAEFYKLVWIDLEHGYNTLTKLPKSWQDNIELITLPDSRVYPIAIETCLKVIKGAECIICEKHGKVSCLLCRKEAGPTSRVCLNELGSDTIVVFDSATQLKNSAISNITKDKPDDYKLDWDDWGQLSVLADKFFSQVQASKCNIIVISHEDEVKMEGGVDKIVPVGGSRNFSRNVAKYFDHVIYTQVKNKKHMFGSATTYALNVVTGSRTDVKIEANDTPTLLDIFKIPASASPATQAEILVLPKRSEGEDNVSIKTTTNSGNSADTTIPDFTTNVEIVAIHANPSLAPVPSIAKKTTVSALAELRARLKKGDYKV